MASKLNKACREIPGSIADAWRSVAAEMESRGEVHRQFSNSMIEEIVKPLKLILDNQHKTRKAVCDPCATLAVYVFNIKIESMAFFFCLD